MISLDQIRNIRLDILDQKYQIRLDQIGIRIIIEQVGQIRLDQIDQIRLVLVRLESDLIRQIRLDQNQITQIDRLGQIRQIRLGQVDQIRLKLDSIRQSR